MTDAVPNCHLDLVGPGTMVPLHIDMGVKGFDFGRQVG